jgi:hypothetical protein
MLHSPATAPPPRICIRRVGGAGSSASPVKTWMALTEEEAVRVVDTDCGMHPGACYEIWNATEWQLKETIQR